MTQFPEMRRRRDGSVDVDYYRAQAMAARREALRDAFKLKAAVGFALAPLSRGGRLLYALVSLAVVLPPEAFNGAIWINAAGVTAATVLLIMDWLRRKQGRTAEIAATPY